MPGGVVTGESTKRMPRALKTLKDLLAETDTPVKVTLETSISGTPQMVPARPVAVTVMLLKVMSRQMGVVAVTGWPGSWAAEEGVTLLEGAVKRVGVVIVNDKGRLHVVQAQIGEGVILQPAAPVTIGFEVNGIDGVGQEAIDDIKFVAPPLARVLPTAMPY